MGSKTKIAGWRKIASAAWGDPNDPQIYGDLEIDATNILTFIEEVRDKTDVPLTVTTLVGKAIARAFHDNPDLNVRLYKGHFHNRGTIDIFFIVSAEQGAELSGVKVERTDEKAVVDIARELRDRAARIRTGDDVELGKTKKMISSMPRRLLKWSIRFSAWLTSDRDKDFKKYGLPRQAFGSAIISSVGMFGIEHAYAPLANYYRIPFLVLVGKIAQKPVVRDGEIVARPMLSLSATIDHRYVDGFHAARLASTVIAYLENPKHHEPPIE